VVAPQSAASARPHYEIAVAASGVRSNRFTGPGAERWFPRVARSARALADPSSNSASHLWRGGCLAPPRVIPAPSHHWRGAVHATLSATPERLRGWRRRSCPRASVDPPLPGCGRRSTAPRVVPLRNVTPATFNTRPIATGRLCWIVLLMVFMRARATNKKTQECADNFPTRAAGSLAFMRRASRDVLPVGSILLAALPIHSRSSSCRRPGSRSIILPFYPWICGLSKVTGALRGARQALERSAGFYASRRPTLGVAWPSHNDGGTQCIAKQRALPLRFRLSSARGAAPTPPPRDPTT